MLMAILLLAACTQKERVVTQTASAEAQVVASESSAARAILQNEVREDILSARKNAKAAVSEADVQAVENEKGLPENTVAASLPMVVLASDVVLPAACESYYHRVDACFAKQGEDAYALRQMNEEARLELAKDLPDNEACVALNQSFDNVAANLACE